MKKSFFYTICVMVLATIVAVVSCKKDDPKALLGQNAQPEKTFTVPQVDDMNAYLKGFKQRMQTVTRGEDEMLGLEEAAWHLSSVANYDFANANVEYDDIRFDTLYAQMNITNGEVLLSDLADAYGTISVNIDMLFHSLTLEGKHFKFINVDVSAQGDIIVSIVTTFLRMDRWHYFTDSTFCDQFFSDDITYVANGNAVTELERVFNLTLGHDDSPSGRVYYVKTREMDFYFKHWLEDAGNYCPNSFGYRLYCTDGYFSEYIPKDHMCYYADSYIALGADNATLLEHVLVGNLSHVSGIMDEYEKGTNGINECQIGHHFLQVQYGWAMSGELNDY